MPGGRRQPVARALREFGQAQILEGLDLSDDEVVDRIERGAISRRELLKKGGVLGAALALAACTPRRSSTAPKPAATKPAEGEPRVVVVGAGLAGTTAAYRLTQAGVNCQLFEARDRVGGRCWTARGFANGQTGEHGGEFIDTRHVHIRGLAKELGLTLEDLWEGWVAGSAWLTFVDGKVARWGDWKEQQQPIVDAVNAEAKRLGVLGKGHKPTDAPISYGTATPQAEELDQMSMAEFLDDRAPGITGSPLGTFLDEVMASWYGLNMSGLSSLNWIDYYVIPYPGADERYHIEGGNDQVPVLAAEKLPAGTLHLEAPLEAMRKRSEGGYELRFAGTSQPVVADYVILTVPYTTLAKVDLENAGFGGYRMNSIRTHAMGTDVKMFLQYGKRPQDFKTPEGVWSGGMEHGDAQFETWESSVLQPGKTALITVYAGGRGSTQFAAPDYHAAPPAGMVEQTLGHINDAVPGTAQTYNGQSWLDYWTGDPWTAGSYAAFGPGQYTKFWRYDGLPEGRVHFAGELTSTYSQGYLNGGVESGQRTAIEVMEAIGVPVPKEIASLPYSIFG